MVEDEGLNGLDAFAAARKRMLERDIRRRGVTATPILSAMGKVPRHLFVPPDLRSSAYDDRALPIGGGQTISQPYIVARMIALAAVGADSKVLDVGTGSGYAAAVLAEIVDEVVTIEVRPDLAAEAAGRLTELGYDNVVVHTGDARRLELGQFDAILVAAAATDVPPGLEDQLAEGGRLVIPLGGRMSQRLWVVERQGDQLLRESHEAVAFVPLIEK